MKGRNITDLGDIFEGRIFRIPDYQRGFAWQDDPELNDFWKDLIYLSEHRAHYTGSITLDPVDEEDYEKWDHSWLISELGLTPYFVVDGQQRLVTSLILIQSIIVKIINDFGKSSVNDETLEVVHSRYIYRTAANSQVKGFLFEYVEDDPSNEFLKTEIFGEVPFGDSNQHTLYTRNLRKAKKFFEAKLSTMDATEVGSIFTKLTQNFKYSLYEIDREFDVFITFETINSRGRQLSNLERIKNRLIYLTTLFDKTKDIQCADLRKKINECWKQIYKHLGMNADDPLDEDFFLQNHWIMYFGRGEAYQYADSLLNEVFTSQNVTHPETKEKRLTVDSISNYITSLRQSIEPWFYIHNPFYPGFELGDNESDKFLGQLNRLGFGAFRPLILAYYTTDNNYSTSQINRLLDVAEKYVFTIFRVSQRRSNTGRSHFHSWANKVYWGNVDSSIIVDDIKHWTENYYGIDRFHAYIRDKYKFGGSKKGFYGWGGLQYLLYEYEQKLFDDSKSGGRTLEWKDFTGKRTTNHITIEHIYPQNPTDKYWTDLYKEFDDEQKEFLAHSLGNLLPLLREKNSSLQNFKFSLKKDNGRDIGYFNGSCSENAVNKKEDWGAKEIHERGLELLEFMRIRWGIDVGDDRAKTELLHLKFLVPKNG